MYFCCNNDIWSIFSSLIGEQLATIITKLIRLLRDIGYNIVIVNGDQSAVNRKCYNLLGASETNPYFHVDDSKVYAIFDLPHLIKSLRETFLKHGLHTVDGKVSGEIVRQCYNASRESSLGCKTL